MLRCGIAQPQDELQTILGCNKRSGAPPGMNEHDIPDYSKDPADDVIALDAHIHLANPRTPETDSSLMLRRDYSYFRWHHGAGLLGMGLLFVCYQHDLAKGFLTAQPRLNGEAQEEYICPIGGGILFRFAGRSGWKILSRAAVTANLINECATPACRINGGRCWCFFSLKLCLTAMSCECT